MPAMPFLRLAAITCVCYLLLAALSDVVLSIYLARRDVLFSFSSWPGYLWSGSLWFVSYTVAITAEWLIARSRL